MIFAFASSRLRVSKGMNFVNSMQRIEAFVAKHQPPYIAKVYRASPADLVRNPTAKGTISLWCPT
ncbi:MAG TPA: hypothetical protein VHX14_00500 [Thermoanaerobaculia bacterium]|nr:hypothetical protein [Thermoanaerobaculia bacterium]